MSRLDARNLVRFNMRMGMFICPSDRWNVVSFLHGYELARGKRCRFLELLSQQITDDHQIKLDCLGWPGQIERLAEKYSLDWMETYLLISSNILNSALYSPRNVG